LLNFDRIHAGTTPVGFFPDGASPYGALDMAGNVWEWVADWYDPDYYAAAPSMDPPGGRNVNNTRVLRGGEWGAGASAARSANRFSAFPGRHDFDGFRCALGG
jgi:formylglycine-generating enzyme required for sulfatase activity